MKWRLEDVVDFEALLVGGVEELHLDGRDRELVQEAAGKIRDEGRRRGLRAWLESRRAESQDGVGQRTVEGLRLAGGLAGVLVFLAALGLVRGLMVELEGGRRMFNIWLFLGVTVGLQWLMLLGSALGYLILRRQRGVLSLGPRILGVLARWFSGRIDGRLWQSLQERGRGYGSILSWRLARLAQGVGVVFNLGLMAGFLGCLWFLKVGFFWESTILDPPTMLRIASALALPWSWSGLAVPPELSTQQFDLLNRHFYEAGGGSQWWPFLMTVLAVWGLLPRLLLWVFCRLGGRRSLAGLQFQEPRHRELWRGLSGVQRDCEWEGPADGVVLLDVGGSGVKTQALREFLLRVMRVHPEERYEAAVLDGAREAEAWRAIRQAPLGVVLLVEAWALSPKQMNVIYERVRDGDASRPVRFLVLGTVRDGQAEPPDPEDFAQWKHYVDGLRDPAAEVVAYRDVERLRDES